MIKFESILKNELLEFLSIREATLAKVPLAMTAITYKNLTIILCAADTLLKNFQKIWLWGGLVH